MDTKNITVCARVGGDTDVGVGVQTMRGVSKSESGKTKENHLLRTRFKRLRARNMRKFMERDRDCHCRFRASPQDGAP